MVNKNEIMQKNLYEQIDQIGEEIENLYSSQRNVVYKHARELKELSEIILGRTIGCVLGDLYNPGNLNQMEDNREKIRKGLWLSQPIGLDHLDDYLRQPRDGGRISDQSIVTVGYLLRVGIFPTCNGTYGNGSIKFKNPSGCSKCIETKSWVSDAGLDDLVQFEGERCYCIPPEIFSNAERRILMGDGEYRGMVNLLGQYKDICDSRIHSLENKRSELGALHSAYYHLDEKGVDLERITETMPDFIMKVAGSFLSLRDAKLKNQRDIYRHPVYITADTENGIGVLLEVDTRHIGSYFDRMKDETWYHPDKKNLRTGVSLHVFYGGKFETKFFCTRDDGEGTSNPDLDFNTAEIENVTSDGFNVVLGCEDKSLFSTQTEFFSFK